MARDRTSRYPAAVIASEANRPPAGSIPPGRTSVFPNPPQYHHLPSGWSANPAVAAATLVSCCVIWNRSANPSRRPIVRGPATVRAARGRHSRP